MSKNLFNLLLLVGTVALYMLVISPLYKGSGGVWQPEHSIVQLKEMNVQYDETIAKAESLVTETEAMKSEYESISEGDKKKMLVMVPDSIDKVRILSEMVSLSSTIGMPMMDLSYAEGPVNPAGRGSASITFSTKTSYSKFKEFIDAFEKSMRLLSIQSISFGEPDENDLISFDVKLETYYMK